MEAALSLILEPAARSLSQVETYHWVSEGQPSSVYAKVYERVPWLPEVYLFELAPAFPRTELAKELGKDEVFRKNYREGSCLAVEFRPREYRGYVPAERVVQFQGSETELSTALWALRGLPYIRSLDEVGEEELQQLATGGEMLTIRVLKKGEGVPSSVSFVREWQCWAVACKHDSILVRGAEDVKPEGRWKTVSKFAEFWLEHIQSLPSESLASLQQALTGYTLVGEFSSENTLILPKKQGFCWYARVGKEDAGICEGVSTTSSLFAEFPFLTHCELTHTAAADRLLTTLREVGNTASCSPMLQSGRESLILIEAQGSVVAGFQAKNYEYSIYLKLFDSLALSLRNEVPPSVPLLKLLRETTQLSTRGLLPAPIDFYESLIRCSFDLLGTEIELFRRDFSLFLEESQKRKAGEVRQRGDLASSVVLITPPLYFTVSELKQLQVSLNVPHPLAWEWREGLRDRPAGVTLYCLHLIPRLTDSFDQSSLLIFAGFSEEGKEVSLKRLSEAKRAPTECPGVFSFVKSADCETKLNRLMSQGVTEAEHLKLRWPGSVMVFPNIQSTDLPDHILPRISSIPQSALPRTLPIQKLSKKPLLCLLVPLGIPGMGKSSLIPQLREVASLLSSDLEVISSDVIREQCIKAFMQKNKIFDAETAFERTAKTCKDLFYQKLRQAVHSGRERLIIYLDKNHPPNAVQPLLKETRQYPDMRLIAIVPLCASQTLPRFELSVAFLAQCLVRVLRRQSHETLTGSPAKRVSVTLMMFQMFREFSFQQLLAMGFASVVRVPFTDETTQVPVELGRCLYELTTGVAPKEQLAERLAEHLAELVEQWTEPMKEVDSGSGLLEGLRTACA